jgi:hypothetical protein
MRTKDFDVVDTLLHDLSESTGEITARQDLTTCRDTTSDHNCGCGGGKDKPKPKPHPKTASLRHAIAREARVLVKA